MLSQNNPGRLPQVMKITGVASLVPAVSPAPTTATRCRACKRVFTSDVALRSRQAQGVNLLMLAEFEQQDSEVEVAAAVNLL